MEFLDSMRTFLNAGGHVLWSILYVSLLLWCLIGERLIFFGFYYPALKQRCLSEWTEREDRHSAQALSIRECIISEARMQMSSTVPIIKVLVHLCPLLGLLGTVTGMIHVFDVLAVTGTGNARAMASGVSQATIPTMAGMVIAISGLYFVRLIEERVSDELHRLADLLTYH